MGGTKRLMERHDSQRAIAVGNAIQAKVLKYCKFHDYVYDPDTLDITPAYKLANYKFTRGELKETFDDRTEMAAVIKSVVEDAADECYYCAKHAAE